MGTHREEVFIPVSASKPNASTWDLVDQAVRQWRDDEDTARSHGANTGFGTSAPGMTRAHVDRFLDGRFERLLREAVVVPILESVERERTVKTTVDRHELDALIRRDPDAFDALTARMRVQHGADVYQATVTGFPKPRKPAATITDGKAVTEYQVFERTLFNRRFVTAAATQAEARQKALNYITANPQVNDLEITAVIRRDTGEDALVRVNRPVAETSTITVKLHTSVRAKNTKVLGHLVAFSVHT